MVKGSAGHRRGKQDFRESARRSTKAVREAGKRAAGSRPAGQRPPADGTKAVAAPDAGCEAGVWAKERHFGR